LKSEEKNFADFDPVRAGMREKVTKRIVLIRSSASIYGAEKVHGIRLTLVGGRQKKENSIT
jgi:hypothetical protein